MIFFLRITRSSFPRHLAEVCTHANFNRNLPSGFAEAGIFPFNLETILATAYQKPKVPPAQFDLTRHRSSLMKIEEIMRSEMHMAASVAHQYVMGLTEAISKANGFVNCLNS